MALFVSGNNPFAQRKYLQPEELHALPLLFYPNVDKKFGYHAILKYFSATQTYTMSTSDLILNMVADDACTALASRLLLSDSPLLKNGQIIQLPIAGYPMSMIYYLLFPAEAQISTAEKIVVSAIQEAFAQLEEKIFKLLANNNDVSHQPYLSRKLIQNVELDYLCNTKPPAARL